MYAPIHRIELEHPFSVNKDMKDALVTKILGVSVKKYF
jgi:hypothetical protein